VRRAAATENQAQVSRPEPVTGKFRARGRGKRTFDVRGGGSKSVRYELRSC